MKCTLHMIAVVSMLLCPMHILKASGEDDALLEAEKGESAAQSKLSSIANAAGAAQSTYYNAASNLSAAQHAYYVKRSPFGIDLFPSYPTDANKHSVNVPYMNTQLRIMQGVYFFSGLAEYGLGLQDSEPSFSSYRVLACGELSAILGPVILRLHKSIYGKSVTFDSEGNRFDFTPDAVGIRVAFMGNPVFGGLQVRWITPKAVTTIVSADATPTSTAQLPTEFKNTIEVAIALNLYSHVIK